MADRSGLKKEIFYPEDSKDVINLNDYKKARVESLEEHAKTMAALNLELYDLRKKYGSKSYMVDAVRDEFIRLSKEGGGFLNITNHEKRRRLIDQAIENVEEGRPIQEKQKRADVYIKELFKLSTFDMSSDQTRYMVDFLKEGEYWNSSKAHLRMIFDSKMAEWIKMGALKHSDGGAENQLKEIV